MLQIKIEVHAGPVFEFIVNAQGRVEPEEIDKALAAVIRSGLMRGAVTAILWMFRTKVPQKTFAYSEDARAWSQSQISETSLVQETKNRLSQ